MVGKLYLNKAVSKRGQREKERERKEKEGGRKGRKKEGRGPVWKYSTDFLRKEYLNTSNSSLDGRQSPGEREEKLIEAEAV